MVSCGQQGGTGLRQVHCKELTRGLGGWERSPAGACPGWSWMEVRWEGAVALTSASWSGCDGEKG